MPTDFSGLGLAHTVLGPIPAAKLGVTLPHEHLIVSTDCWFQAPTSADGEKFAAAPILLRNLGRIRRTPFQNLTNLQLNDPALAMRELRQFRQGGGSTIVELSLPGIGRDLSMLEAISRRTKVNIVAGTGYYVAATHPPEVSRMTEDQIAEFMVGELRPATGGIPAGVIGEIGTSQPITAAERTVLRAAAKAHKRTGAPISIHALPPGRTGLEALILLEEQGVDPGRVVISHMDTEIDLDYHREVARHGAYVEYDLFGYVATGEDELAERRPPPPSDSERIRALATLIQEGSIDRLLLSHDICMKIQLTSYGGFGYAHLTANLPPTFEYFGIDAKALNHMTVMNPARWLAWDRE